jgi:hypothetical protein
MKNNQNNNNGPALNGQQDEQEFLNVNSSNFGEIPNEEAIKPPISVQTNTIAKNEEVGQPVKQETKGLDSLAKNQEEINHFYQTNLDKNWTTLEKWTNNSMYKQVQEVKKELFKTSAHYRLAFYRTMLDTRLETLNEKCNAGIKMVKGHYRHQVSSYLMSKMEQISFEVKDRQVAFLEMMKTKYSYSETLAAYPSMQQRYLTSIFDEEGKYLKFLDGLLDNFQSIIDEELKKYN